MSAPTSDYMPSELGKDTRNEILTREKRRSLSLDNINIMALQSYNSTPTDEKTSVLSSTQTNSRIKGLKKKLSIKLSKSSTELAAQNIGVSDTNKLTPTYSGGSSPREIQKYANKDQPKKRRGKFSIVSDAVADSSTTGKFVIERFDINSNIHHGSSLDSSDNLLISESPVVIKCEYLDDASSTYETDEPDGAALADQQIEKLWRKIEKTREDLIQQQAIKDENVSEYLKTTDNPTESTSNAKMKLNFERNNQKTNINIQLLQKKLDKYQQQVKEIEENGVPGTKRIMKVVQNSVRSGTSSIADAVSKPLESFNNFIKKEKKNSSAENVYGTLTDNDDEIERGIFQSIQTTSDEENVSSSTSNIIRSGLLENIRQKLHNSENRDDELDALKICVEKLERENEESKQNIEQFKERLNRVLQSLQDERYKTEQLQIRLNDLFNQWNDLTELHQNEMMGMKEEMDRTLENIECVEYRFTERTADLEEDVENCVTRISKMEKQQQDQQPINTFLDMDAKILLSKFLSFIINICVVIIFVISSLTKLVMPFVASRTRFAASGIAVIAFLVLWKNSDHELFRIFRDLFQPINNL